MKRRGLPGRPGSPSSSLASQKPCPGKVRHPSVHANARGIRARPSDPQSWVAVLDRLAHEHDLPSHSTRLQQLLRSAHREEGQAVGDPRGDPA